jgi:DNA-binding LacI/PurR family transcriptional regulator
MSRTDLANAMGVSKTTVSRWNSNPPQYAVTFLSSVDTSNRIKQTAENIIDNFTEQLKKSYEDDSYNE